MRKPRIPVGPWLVALAVALAVPSWKANAEAGTISISGAGSTFGAPLYTKWFSEYRKVDPSVEINYQAIGSGGGIRQLLDKTIDFGASDAPMTDAQLAKASIPILHIPTVLGAVVITYNLPGVTKPIRLTGEAIADIFLGKITKWDDSRITKLNPGIAFPAALDVLVAHRSDGSGTTAVFSDYLSKESAEWKSQVGAGVSLDWPVGLGGKGNDGVMSFVSETPGAVGYVELIYAATNKLPVALVRNAAGRFVEPTPQTVAAAADGARKSMPKDFRVSITDAAGKGAYPISSFTYLLVYRKLDPVKGPKLVRLLHWAMRDGQKAALPLHYAPLPRAMVPAVEARIDELR